MTRSPKLIAGLVLLAGIGSFGRAAFAADSTTDSAHPATELERPVAAEMANPAVDTPVPAAPVADTAAPAPSAATAPATQPPVSPAADPVAPAQQPADEQPAAEESVAPTDVESATAATATPTKFAPAADIAYDGATAAFLAATNASRAEVGAAPLVPNAALSAYAAQHAATMGRANHLHHSDIGVLVGSWSTVGENVGVGPSVAAIHAALLASPGHYRNLADAGFTHVGIGVYTDAGGRTWTAHVFAT